MAHLSIPDNSSRKAPDSLTEIDRLNIKKIAGISLSDLINNDKTDSDHVLVFPNDPDSLKDQYSSQKILGFDNDFITTGNTMGFIGIGDTIIRIHSRFDQDNRDYLLHYLLQRVLQINLFDLHHSSALEDAFDFLILIFPYYLKKAMRQGLLRQYVSKHHNDSAVKGVLDINRHIKQNFPFNGKIAYNSRHFSVDNPMLKLIRLTALKILKNKFGSSVLNSDADIRACIRELEKVTPSFNERESARIISQCIRSSIHPYYYEYEPLRKLCIMILRNEGIKYGRNEKRIYGILFDGAWLWEEYMGLLLKGRFDHLYKNRGPKFYLFAEGNKRFQQIIPDFLSKDKSQIGDAKYIPLESMKTYGDERATAIYYKTITYMNRFNSNQGFLFFPCGSYQGENPYKATYEVLSQDPSAPYRSLTKLGLQIPPSYSCKDFKEFSSSMHMNEEMFLAAIPV